MWLNSRIIAALITGLLAAGDETTSGGASRSYEIGVVRSLPCPDLGADSLSSAGAEIASSLASLDEFDETASRFVAFVNPAHWATEDLRIRLEAIAISSDAERSMRRMAEIDEDGALFIEHEVGLHPDWYERHEDLDDEIARLYPKPIKAVIDEFLGTKGGMRAIASLSFVGSRRLEVIAHGLEVHPESIVRVATARGLVSPEHKRPGAVRLISYLVGVAFGRWDIRLGRDSSSAPVQNDLLAQPTRYAPARLLTEEGHPPDSPSDDYPMSFPTDGVLIDEPGNNLDIGRAVRDAARHLFDSETELDEALRVLMKRPSLTDFLRSGFFGEHLSMYSMSRRKAPIYWQLQVPSKQWGVWLYAPKLSREMLFAVVGAAEDRLRLAERQVGRLQDETESGSGGRKASEVAKELEAEQQLLVELGSFRKEAERIANLGWQPDLDDGMVLNAAPLADLFPAWKDAAKYRSQLRDGEYRWATVANYADRI